MEYYKQIKLKDGRDCCLRNGVESDGPAVLDYFIQAHTETDYLLSYPDETTMTAEEEGKYLQEKADSSTTASIRRKSVPGKSPANAAYTFSARRRKSVTKETVELRIANLDLSA